MLRHKQTFCADGHCCDTKIDFHNHIIVQYKCKYLANLSTQALSYTGLKIARPVFLPYKAYCSYSVVCKFSPGRRAARGSRQVIKLSVEKRINRSLQQFKLYKQPICIGKRKAQQCISYIPLKCRIK
jgi:hypothetical protein